jgi:hypothetical protein
MLNVIPGRPFLTTDKILASAQFAPSGNIELILISGKWQSRTPATFAGDNAAAGVANGAALTLATVTAGKLAVIDGFIISTSALGIIRLRHNGIAIGSATLAAGGFATVSLPKGWIAPTTGGVIDILNSTGAASNIAGCVYFSEYTP